MTKYLLLDTSFNIVSVVDTFDSLIWTDRFAKAGDFEIFMAASTEAYATYQEDFYLWSSDSEHVMIIEDQEFDTDVEEGSHFKVTGRSLESILDRRIIWGQMNLAGNLQNEIKRILDTHVILATDVTRRMPIVFQMSTDPRITSLTITQAQYFGENIYEVITKLCETYKIGFKITLNSSNQFVFRLYSGDDRSYDQVVNPQVIFSPNFDNLADSNHLMSKRPLKTVNLTVGEGEGALQKMVMTSIPGGAGSGLNRRELYTNGKSISSKTDGADIPAAQYLDMLRQKGYEDLALNAKISAFDGQIEAVDTFAYLTDFFMGDIVQLANEYGMSSKSRVTEFIRSVTPSGNEAYPTLESV